MASRSRSSTSSSSTVDAGQQPPGVTPPVAVAGRPRVLDGSHHADQSCLTRTRTVSRRRPRRASGSTPRNIHISAMRSPSNRYTKALRDSSVLSSPGAAERGVLPLGRPPVGADAELLVEVDLAVGHLEDRAEDFEEPAEARRGRPPSGAGHGGGTTRSSVKILARVSWSWSKIALVMRFTVSTLGWSCSSVLQELVVGCPRDRTKPGCAGTSGEPWILRHGSAQQFYRCRLCTVSVASPDAPIAGRFVPWLARSRRRRTPT